jgi:YggT family protein
MVEVISFLLVIFYLLIIARVLMSWVQVDPYHPVAQFIFQATEPILKPVRDLLPPAAGIDFSPMIVLIAAQVLGQIIIEVLS